MSPRISRIALLFLGFLFFGSTYHAYLADFWILVFLAPRITRITRISGSAYLAYRLDFWFRLPLLSSYYLPPGGAGQRTGAAGYERDFFCALVLLVL